MGIPPVDVMFVTQRRNLSKWQFLVQPVTDISSTARYLCFNAAHLRCNSTGNEWRWLHGFLNMDFPHHNWWWQILVQPLPPAICSACTCQHPWCQGHRSLPIHSQLLSRFGKAAHKQTVHQRWCPLWCYGTPVGTEERQTTLGSSQ